MQVLGVDFGATFIKSALLDLERGDVRDIECAPIPGFVASTQSWRREIDANELFDEWVALLERRLVRFPAVSKVYLASQMHGVIMTDEVGRPRSNFISWQDLRSIWTGPVKERSWFAWLEMKLDAGSRREVGNELRPGLPITQLPSLARDYESACACALSDYLLARLLEQEPVTDPTQAAGSGLFEVLRERWHSRYIEMLGLGRMRFPNLAPTGSPLGSIRLAGRTITFHASIADQQAALLGAGLGEDEVSLNIGAGSQVSRVIANAASISRRFEGQLRPYVGGRYLRTVTHIPAGRALDSLVALLTELGGPPDPWTEILSRADRAEVPKKLSVNLGFFPSAIGSEGSVTGITESELSVGSLFSAAFDGMAERYREKHALLAVSPPPDRILFSGGLALKSALLRRRCEESFGLPSRMLHHDDEVLHGLLKLASGLLE